MSFEDFLQWHSINLRFTNLPCHIRGFATYYGTQYLVIINARCSNLQQQDTIVHELIHILENHFEYPKEYDCEQEVKYIIKEMKENYIRYEH